MPPKSRHQFARSVLRLISAALAIGSFTGCQSITQSSSLSQVRIITASPDAPGLDIYQNNSELVTNLAFGNISSYVPTDPGSYTLSAKAAGGPQTLTSARATLAASGQYTVLLGNFAANLQELVLMDQNKPAPSGQIALRFVNQTTGGGAVDVYLVPRGQRIADVTPLLTNLTFGANTGYLNIPAGTYTVVMVPAGAVPSGTTAAFLGNQITYSSGSARTFILLDQQRATTPFQIITATDYDSHEAGN